MAKHVDVDAVRADSGYHPAYLQAVEKARRMHRALEVAAQALYDDAATLFSAVQAPLSSDFIVASPRASRLYSPARPSFPRDVGSREPGVRRLVTSAGE